jgi:hypothetical protein
MNKKLINNDAEWDRWYDDEYNTLIRFAAGGDPIECPPNLPAVILWDRDHDDMIHFAYVCKEDLPRPSRSVPDFYVLINPHKDAPPALRQDRPTFAGEEEAMKWLVDTGTGNKGDYLIKTSEHDRSNLHVFFLTEGGEQHVYTLYGVCLEPV